MEKLEKKISEKSKDKFPDTGSSSINIIAVTNCQRSAYIDGYKDGMAEVKDIAIAFADYCNKYSFDPNILAPSSYDELFTDFITNYDKQ